MGQYFPRDEVELLLVKALVFAGNDPLCVRSVNFWRVNLDKLVVSPAQIENNFRRQGFLPEV